MKPQTIFSAVLLLACCFQGTLSEEQESHGVKDYEVENFSEELREVKLDEDDLELEDDAKENEVAPEFYSSGDGDDIERRCRAGAKNTDEYVDKVLEEVRPKLPEPALLPNRSGRFRLLNGTLFNLSSVKRIGLAMTRCSGSEFSFLVPIGFKHLYGGYVWELETSLRPLRGSVEFSIGNVEADVLYTRRQTDTGMNATVHRLTISRLEGVDINIEGLGPLNRLASMLSNFLTRVFRRGVARMLEGPVRRIMNNELADIKKYEYYYF